MYRGAANESILATLRCATDILTNFHKAVIDHNPQAAYLFAESLEWWLARAESAAIV